MPLKNIPLTKEDLSLSKWVSVIEECEEKKCHYYSTKFYAKAREFEDSGDEKTQEVFTLLGAITSLMLKAESATEPFGPLFVMSDSRSAITDDFTDNQLEVLAEIINDITDPELQARIADLLWIRKRDFSMAKLAIDAYLRSALVLEDPENWSSGASRIERALRLSRMLGKKTGLMDGVIKHIEEVLDKYEGSDPLFFSQRLMSLLQEVGAGEPKKYIKLSSEIATKAESEGDFYRARSYWEVNASWFRQDNDLEGEKKALINVAETYVKEAATANSNLVAASHQQHAIEAYRRIGGYKERIEELHNALLEYQKKSLNEMGSFSVEGQDLSDIIKDSINKVKGKAIYDAIFELVLMVPSPGVQKLREEVKEQAEKYPLQHLVSAVVVNDEGKVIGRHSNMMSDDPEEVERANREHMFKQAAFHYHIYTHSLIEPVRHHINREHNVRVQDFMRIVSNNPFVPKGREYLYAQGLKAGMDGDFVAAMHLLIPQVEHSIRHILTQTGQITSGIDSSGIQDERSLNTTLYLPELKELMDENIVFDLQGLLVERFGSNLRNRMAHGLMSHNSFYAIEVPYLWCLILKLCCIPIINHINKQKSQKQAKAADEKVGEEDNNTENNDKEKSNKSVDSNRL